MASLLPLKSVSGNPTTRTTEEFDPLGPIVITMSAPDDNVVAALQFSSDNGTTWITMKPDVHLTGVLSANHIKVDTSAARRYRFQVTGTNRANAKIEWFNYTISPYRSL